jgi:hypothetical protein
LVIGRAGEEPHKKPLVGYIGDHQSFVSAAYLMKPPSSTFRGNKASLPSKPCLTCGLPMSWRRSWAKNWPEVKFCSEACRRAKARHG